ncbi:chemotaxis protein MotB [Rhodobacteraceae bacterium WD3A24]|nr:chemotaxis protein MotB [Rhodobacteraceae bacterium WD3A24]
MSRQHNARPVIIKRKKVVAAEGHHGGAWKVAYADFVTAMMAFFLLMWLLNATTESQRKGLADYFSPSVPLTRVSGGGEDAFGGEDMSSQMAIAAMRALEIGRSFEDPALEGAAEETGAAGAGPETLESLHERLMGTGGESAVMQRAMRHVVTRLTDEGLIVEIFDLPGSPLFSGEGVRPGPVLETLAGMLAETFALVRNGVAVEGFTRSYPVVLRDNPVWDVSTARAEAMRALLGDAGLASERMRRVTGHADRAPAADDPMAIRNNRLEVILLRDDV